VDKKIVAKNIPIRGVSQPTVSEWDSGSPIKYFRSLTVERCRKRQRKKRKTEDSGSNPDENNFM
jgi:hypothetical protein